MWNLIYVILSHLVSSFDIVTQIKIADHFELFVGKTLSRNFGRTNVYRRAPTLIPK